MSQRKIGNGKSLNLEGWANLQLSFLDGLAQVQNRKLIREPMHAGKRRPIPYNCAAPVRATEELICQSPNLNVP